MSDPEQEEIQQETDAITFAEFLENTPPSRLTNIEQLATPTSTPMGVSNLHVVVTPDIQLHCSNDACNGTRFFRKHSHAGSLHVSRGTRTSFYLNYLCANCQQTAKTFALMAIMDRGNSGRCYKFGEFPPYGPPTPARLISLIGPDRDLFLKGRRCENQGLGIGAFVYYRRVVENQKNRILDQIIKVSEKLSAPASTIETLTAAKSETQFSKALSTVKDAIPEALLINGHNPLTLLHSALSEGLHDRTDDYCLEIAHSIRVVLAELSERLAQALKDEAEVKHALSTLLRVKNNG